MVERHIHVPRKRDLPVRQEITNPPGVKALREPRPDDVKEVAHYFAAEQSEYMLEVVGSEEDLEATPRSMKGWIKKMRARETVTIKTIIDPDSSSDEAQGWLRVDQRNEKNAEERKRLERIIGEDLPESAPNPCEIAYCPVPGSEHLIQNAIIDACTLISSRDAAQNIKERRAVMIFEGDAPVGQFSRDALMAAGFVCHNDLVRYNEKDENADVRMWTLDWNKHDHLMETRKSPQSPVGHPTGAFTALTDVQPPGALTAARAAIQAK